MAIPNCNPFPEGNTFTIHLEEDLRPFLEIILEHEQAGC